MADLIVFDLDLTLWHCGPLLWCDQLTRPLATTRDGRVVSSCDTEVSLFPEVKGLLEGLREDGHLLGVASRTSAPELARDLLELFGIADHFPHQQIYPGDKAAHFLALQQETGLAFEDMVFFDDEPRNVASVGRLGVSAHLVRNGMTRSLLERVL